MNRILSSILLLVFGSFGLHAVPAVLNYAGQVAVNGQPFDGQGLFKFALVNADGNATYWSNDGTSANGSEPAVHVGIAVNGGLYSLLLGNTAMSGMGAIDPQVFAQNTDAKLRVWFSDGVNGFQQLSPDRPFASVPYAFSAGNAETAGSATIADGSINKSMLGSDVIADLNATIGMNRLSSEVTAKLDQNGSGASGVVAGSIISVPSGQSAPAGYSLYQRGEPIWNWKKKAPLEIARQTYDGVEIVGNNIYTVAGWNEENGSIAMVERYEVSSNSWTTVNPLFNRRGGIATSVLNGKLYAIGGQTSTVEVYDPTTENWSYLASLPKIAWHGSGITFQNKIYFLGGKNNLTFSNEVFCYDEATNQWNQKENMLSARDGHKTVLFENHIWSIGGFDGEELSKVESYDPVSNSWKFEASLTQKRSWSVAWVSNGKIFVGGGSDGIKYLDSIEIYDPIKKRWSLFGKLPLALAVADAVVLNDKVYIVGGSTASGVYSDKVYAADLNASVDGVYDLYRKDGNASAGTPLVQAEVADGSVTASKMASNTITTAQLNEQILKYLKPEITVQPQAQTVFADSNVSFSVTAEGKYLTYQWKKNGVNLAGETNATLTITDANATQHDRNYSVVVSNDFGSVESVDAVLDVNSTLRRDLIGWWKFDETNGTIAHDSSGNGNHGNLVNGPIWTNGKIKGGLIFEGSGGVSIPKHCYPTGIAANVVFWSFGGTELPTQNSIFNAWDGNASFLKIHLPWDDENIYWDYGNSNNRDRSSKAVNSINYKGRWTFWSFSRNIESGVMEIFMDGSLWHTESSKITPSGNVSELISFTIGGGYKGLIDDVRIYDRALSAAEVQALYNLGQ